jgi:small subunit ribosomal protein S36
MVTSLASTDAPAPQADAESDAGESPAAAPETGGGWWATWRPPRLVWLATLLFGLLTTLWGVAVPEFRSPDEPAHVDLIVYLAEGHSYPRYDGRYFGKETQFESHRYLIDPTVAWPVFDAADAPPRHDRPDVDDLGGTAADAQARQGSIRRAGSPYVYNQMPQHPPLYHEAMALLVRAERWLTPGSDLPSLSREIGLLRLANVALILPLPLLAWATARRLGAGDRAASVAALLPLLLPQLTYIGGVVNNDNLLNLLCAVLAVLVVGVTRGERSRGVDVAIGVVLGLALLTKAFALMLIPWVAVAYVMCAWTTGRRRAAAVGLAVAGVVTAAVGGWWWVANWIRYGQPAPTTETLTRTSSQAPAGFVAQPGEFLSTFARRMVSHTWAWIGFGNPKFELSHRTVVVATLAVLVAAVAAWFAASRGRATDKGPRRWDVTLAWLPVLLVGLFVVRRAWGLYATNGRFAFVQGRYLFCAIVAAGAVIAFGATKLLGRWAPAAVLAAAALLQTLVLREVITGSWSGPGSLGPIRGMLAWSTWPTAAVLALGAALLAVALATAWAALAPALSRRDRSPA